MMLMKMNVQKRIDYYLGGLFLIFIKPLVFLVGKMLQRDHTPSIQGRLLFIKMLGGGSLLLALPLILGLKKKYPTRKICILTTPAVKPFAELLAVFDRIYIIDNRSIVGLFKSTFKALVSSWSVDTVIDLEVHSRLTTLFSIFTMARNRLGFYLENVFWRKNLHTHLVFYNLFSPSYFFYEQFAYLLDAQPIEMEACNLHLLMSIYRNAKQANACRTVCIGASCSSLGRERMLNAGQWLEIFKSRIAADEEVVVCFLGGEDDKVISGEIINVLKSYFSNARIYNECGVLSLKDAVRKIHSADEFWGIDSALLHFARLMKTESVSFWGPTAPETRLRKIEGLAEEVFYSKIPCSPCIHVTEQPPCNGNNLCIKAIFNKSLQAQRDLSKIIGIK
jgi:ADP-heptose:LPS heptosyltransferase